MDQGPSITNITCLAVYLTGRIYRDMEFMEIGSYVTFVTQLGNLSNLMNPLGQAVHGAMIVCYYYCMVGGLLTLLANVATQLIELY